MAEPKKAPQQEVEEQESKAEWKSKAWAATKLVTVSFASGFFFKAGEHAYSKMTESKRELRAVPFQKKQANS